METKIKWIQCSVYQWNVTSLQNFCLSMANPEPHPECAWVGRAGACGLKLPPSWRGSQPGTLGRGLREVGGSGGSGPGGAQGLFNEQAATWSISGVHSPLWAAGLGSVWTALPFTLTPWKPATETEECLWPAYQFYKRQDLTCCSINVNYAHPW